MFIALVWSNYASGKLWLWCAVLSYPARIVVIDVRNFSIPSSCQAQNEDLWWSAHLKTHFRAFLPSRLKPNILMVPDGHIKVTRWLAWADVSGINVPEAVTSIHYSGTEISTEGINLIYRLTCFHFQTSRETVFYVWGAIREVKVLVWHWVSADLADVQYKL